MNGQRITIPVVTRDEVRLVIGIARLTAKGDEATLHAINRVALSLEGGWAMEDQKARQEGEKTEV